MTSSGDASSSVSAGAPMPVLGLALTAAERTAFNAALATRYLFICALMMLIFDHALTLPREIALVWRARMSVVKAAFLFNRYIVPGALFVMLYAMVGFEGMVLTDGQCQSIITMAIVVAVCTMALANFTVLMRVAALWEHKRAAVLVLAGTFGLSYCAVLAALILTIVRILESVQWNPLVRMCLPMQTTPYLTAVWGIEMLFEVSVLAATLWNAIDRPRVAQQPLLASLRRDGIVYFALISLCRAVNLVLAATGDARFAYIALFPTWALVALLLSRLLLRLRAREDLTHPRSADMPEAGIRARTPRPGTPGSSRALSGARGVDHLAKEDAWTLRTLGSFGSLGAPTVLSPLEVEVGKVELVVADR